MYSIRVEPETNQLLVTLTGRVSTAEALRAASQAFTLAEAGRIAAIAWLKFKAFEDWRRENESDD